MPITTLSPPALLALVVAGAMLAACGANEGSVNPADPPGPVEDVEDVSAVADASDTEAPETTQPPEIVADSTPVEPDTGPTDPPPTPPDPKVCSGSTTGILQSLGGACCYTPYWNVENPNCVWYHEDYDEGACVDAQCESGYCASAKYCTQGCLMYGDSENNTTGASGPDGVNDGFMPEDCEAALDGPMGQEYHCVNVNEPGDTPKGYCRPGTTFAQCERSADCPAGESCTLLYMLGETQARCMTPAEGSVGMAEPCNSDPNEGEIVRCAGPFCYGFGCVELCGGQDECATDQCVDGACAKNPAATCESHTDCSALTCEEMQPYSNSFFTDDFCYPRDCRLIGDCKDPDWFCRPYWNGADAVEEVAFDPSCRPKAEGVASYGEPCGVSGDGTDLPPCVWSSGCIDGYCGGPCLSDSDCGEGAECLHASEWTIDVDDDGTTDTYVNVDACQKWPHEGDLVNCTSDGDCPIGHHCQYRVKGEGEDDARSWEVQYVCRLDAESQVSFGEMCDSGGPNFCDSDLCLVPGGSDDIPAMCTSYCDSAASCPEEFFFDGLYWKSICLSFRVSHGDNEDPVDDIYVPYCWRTSAIGTLDPCDAQMDCVSLKDYCRALPIAGNPDEPVTVEHLCVDASYGLDAIPTKEVGEPCASWTECRGLSCKSDGEGGGYCSELCGADADCQSEGGIPGLACTEQTLIPRPNPAHAGVTKRCLLEKTCLSCDDDEDCGGDDICVNMGGLQGLAVMRCASPCQIGDPCPGEDETCTELVMPDGSAAPSLTCVPDICPQDRASP